MRELFEQIVWRDHILTLAQLAGSIVLLIASLIYYFDEQENLNIAKANLDGQIFANDEAEAASFVLREYLEEYRSLQSSGHIGPPRRLQWLESLRNVSERNDIPGVDFTLESSSLVLQNEDPYWQEQVPVRATDMKLTMQLSHEGDFYQTLEGLSQTAPGLFDVDNCSVRWLENFSASIALTRLRGGCTLRWYSIDDVTADWGKDS